MGQQLTTRWRKMTPASTTPALREEYRVTVATLTPKRTRAWKDYLYELQFDREVRTTTLLQGLAGLVFGVNHCVSIYSNGRLVARRWAGVGPLSPQRVAHRAIGADLRDLERSTRTVYKVKASISA